MLTRLALKTLVRRAVVLAYREDTQLLEAALATEGLNARVQRASYSETELSYSRMFRCFMNHHEPWKLAAQSSGWTLIMESDFVPCQGFGALPVPIPDVAEDGPCWAYLYVSAARAFWREPGGYLRGHNTCPVAYLINPWVATQLLAFWAQETVQRGIGPYYTYDAHMQWSLMKLGARAYLPLRSYGEHGGLANPEHRQHWSLVRHGEHQADVLAAPLCFLPTYARGSRWRYRHVRLIARLRSAARVLCGRWWVPVDVRRLSFAAKLGVLWLGLQRQFKP